MNNFPTSDTETIAICRSEANKILMELLAAELDGNIKSDEPKHITHIRRYAKRIINATNARD